VKKHRLENTGGYTSRLCIFALAAETRQIKGATRGEGVVGSENVKNTGKKKQVCSGGSGDEVKGSRGENNKEKANATDTPRNLKGKHSVT